jgi:hypothetical protein
MQRVTRTLMTLAAILSAGCASESGTHETRIVERSAGLLPPGTVISIDGKADEAVWQKAVTVPIEERGQAQFLWDNERLYGFISQYGGDASGLLADEQVCVSVWIRDVAVKLFFEEARGTNAAPGCVGLRTAWIDPWPDRTKPRQPLAPNSLQFAGGSRLVKEDRLWWVEFSLDWRNLPLKPKGTDYLGIRIYRLLPELLEPDIMMVWPPSGK